jgi:hypothetical protein
MRQRDRPEDGNEDKERDNSERSDSEGNSSRGFSSRLGANCSVSKRKLLLPAAIHDE